MEATVIISLCSLGVAAIAFLSNTRKDTRGDAAREARTETKLDNIINGVSELRVEMRTLSKRIDGLDTRVTRSESEIAEAFRRIEDLERFTRQAHPPV